MRSPQIQPAPEQAAFLAKQNTDLERLVVEAGDPTRVAFGFLPAPTITEDWMTELG